MIEYIVLKKNYSEAEIKSRLNFCTRVFNTYFLIERKPYFIKFVSFPKTKNKYLFLTGHNYLVYDYLKYIKRKVNTLVIISCKLPTNTFNKIKAKRVYVSNAENNITNYYDGKEWGFNFMITNEELNLYNYNDTNLNIKITNTFRRIR